jgi:hypothetical protein
MPLGLGSNLSRAISKPVTPGIVTDNLVLKHNYNSGNVIPCSDGAAFFDGSDDYIECGTTGLNPNSVTVSTWVKFPGEDSSDNYARIFEADGDEKSYHLRYDKSGNKFVVRLSSNGSDHTLCQGTAVVTSFAPWYHVAFTYNTSDGAIKLYVNGAFNATATHSGGGNLHVPSTPGVRIGQESNTTNNNWDGYICNIGIWSSVLTQPQIKSIMNKNYAGLTSSEKTNLVSWWNLDASYSSSDGDTNVVFDNHHSGGESLGSEMVIDGSFNNNATSWTTNTSNDSVVSISNNAATVTNSGTTGYGSIQQASTDFVDGNYYKLTFDVTALTTSDSVTVYNYNSNLTKTLESITTPVTITDYFLASNTDGVDIRAICSNGESITIDNISVKQVNGNTGTLS